MVEAYSLDRERSDSMLKFGGRMTVCRTSPGSARCDVHPPPGTKRRDGDATDTTALTLRHVFHRCSFNFRTKVLMCARDYEVDTAQG